jgi:AcrR family transcriptional regulator
MESAMMKSTNESRRRILEEAIGIVHRGDVDGITMRGLAEKVGHSAAAIYLHFDGKEELEREIALHGFELLEERIAPTFALADPFEALEELVRRYVQFGISHPRLYALMFQDLTGLRTLGLAGHPRLLRLREGILGICERGIASGAFLAADPAQAMAVRWAMAHGFVQLVLAQRLPEDPGGSDFAHLRDALIQTMLRSLRP